MKRFKILHINDFHYGGGAEKVFRDTIEVTKRDYDVKWFFAEERDSSRMKSVTSIFLQKTKTPIQSLLDNFSPDIIHIHNLHNRIGPSVFIALENSRKKGISPKVIMTLHDYFFLWPNPSYSFYKQDGTAYKIEKLPRFWNFVTKKAAGKTVFHSWMRKLIWLYTLFFIKLNRDVHIIASPSQFLADRVNEKYPLIKTIVLRNPCDITLSANDEPLPANSSSEVLKIIFLGRLSSEKGLINLILLAKNCPTPLEIHIYGDGPQKEEIQELVQKNSLGEKIKLMGLIGDKGKTEVLKKYHALTLPSIWYENAPLSIVEAAFAGLRILTCNYGGMKEMGEICGGEYLFDPVDQESFNRIVAKCFSDVINQLPIEGRDQIKLLDEFSPSKYTSSLLTLYSQVLED